MTQITLNKLTVKHHLGKMVEIDISDWSQQFVEHSLAYAFDVKVQRARAKIDKDDPEKDQKRRKVAMEMYNDLLVGKMPEKGGSARLSPTDRGWIAYFQSEKHKEAGKQVNGETLERAQTWYCRQVLLGYYDPGSAERKDIEQNTKKYLDKHSASIIEAAEKDTDEGEPGFFIKIERDKAAGMNAAKKSKTPKGFKIG